MTDHDFDELFARVTAAPFDEHDDVARRQAYQKCVDYATNTMGYTFDANTFLARAAEKLHTERAVLGVVKTMVERPPNARLHLSYHEQSGPELIGNPDGLRYLGELCRVLATATSLHEHIHLYQNEPPWAGKSFGLTIYNEPSDWFDRHLTPDEDEGDASDTADDGPPRREIEPESVVALGLFGKSPFPPFLLLTAGRLYRVQKWAAWKKQNVAAKTLRENDKSRMVVWTLQNDAQKKVKIAFDLDDPDVRYFTAPDLQQI